MKIYYNYWSTVIEDLKGSEVTLSFLHDYYQLFLKKIRFLMDKDTINRCVEVENYSLINGHGGLRGIRLYKFVCTVLDEFKVTYEARGILPDYLEEKLKIQFPVLISPGEYTGGGLGDVNTTDSLSIDLGIKPLCDAINSIEGLETYGSCEGHGFIDRDICNASVVYVVQDPESLRVFVSFLKKLLPKIGSKFKIEQNYFSNISDIIGYKLNIRYIYSEQTDVFEFIKLISKKIIEANI